jgi:hypothetical protein
MHELQPACCCGRAGARPGSGRQQQQQAGCGMPAESGVPCAKCRLLLQMPLTVPCPCHRVHLLLLAACRFYQHLPNACEWAFGIVSGPAPLPLLLPLVPAAAHIAPRAVALCKRLVVCRQSTAQQLGHFSSIAVLVASSRVSQLAGTGTASLFAGWYSPLLGCFPLAINAGVGPRCELRPCSLGAPAPRLGPHAGHP